MVKLGASLGDFILEAEIGRGGMGVVYLARQKSLGRRVALKVLPRELTNDPMYVGRFKREAEAISRLDHAHVVPVIAVGEDDGHHYIAMKFVPGATLDALIRARARGEGPPLVSSEPTVVLSRRPDGACTDEGDGVGPSGPACAAPGVDDDPRGPRIVVDEGFARFSLAAEPAWRAFAVETAEKIALALSHAHAHGIVHRDVKPGNILVDREGDPWLLDFGLVKDLADDRTFCDGRTVLGTAQYMSPEQVRGLRKFTDQRSDVYSLGVTLYETLTLKRPFDDRDTTAILHAVVAEEPPSPRSVVRDLPLDLESVVLKAMAKRPSERYATAAEFAADLRRFRNAEPVVAVRRGFRAWRKQFRRAQAGMVAASLAAFLGVAGVAGVVLFGGDKDDERRAAERTEADAAYFAGDLMTAVERYGVFRRLGGRDPIVDARLADCRRRLASAATSRQAR
jgi:serine/threonine protein kinase